MRRIDAGQGGNQIITRTCATLQPNMKAAPAPYNVENSLINVRS
jgi:hypothetical protein